MQPDDSSLESRFDGLRGQLQVGGPYVGLEFHHSRPLPSRVSFYYPVANSIDLSTDYWQRDASMPFSTKLTVGGRSMSIGDAPYPYSATPAHVVFEKDTLSLGTRVAFHFGSSLPVFVYRITVTNRDDVPTHVELDTRLKPTLRTSHAYDFKIPTRSRYMNGGSVYRADYDDAATDSAIVFVVNAGAEPSDRVRSRVVQNDQHDVRFSYHATLAPGQAIEVVQIIGSSRPSEFVSLLPRIQAGWRDDVDDYERRVVDYALRTHRFEMEDAVLRRTEQWSKAILAANTHYLDGRMVPMPTPAQYNFFFTHDLLLTDLGAVMFDTARVARDLRYLARLAHSDSLLPHAYYWRNGDYVTEYAGSDNWNHLWFILLSSSYLKHSADHRTVRQLWPMIRQSLRLMLKNERNGLMYSERPDWWDIGHVYGARAYLTTLMVRTLRSYVYLSLELGYADDAMVEHLNLAARMQEQLVDQLWDEEAGYLLNMLDSVAVDSHFYSGSLLAAAFDLLEPVKKDRLLESAGKVLLDENIGIRNAMPPDYLDLIDRYRFNGPEVGAPYQYMNGGVWPQGIAWYAMAMLSAGRPDEAEAILKRYLTLDGIERSPNGQPALFEYRNADASAPEYGRIDKTTFLWAGGWYLYVLYQLAGVRENEWNLWFNPQLPSGFGDLEYDLTVRGRKSHVTWRGDGRFLESVHVDGRRVYSAVASSPADSVALQRGLPDAPYLACASAIVEDVVFESSNNRLTVALRGLRGQSAEVVVVSPTKPKSVLVNGRDTREETRVVAEEGAFVISLSLEMDVPSTFVSVDL